LPFGLHINLIWRCIGTIRSGSQARSRVVRRENDLLRLSIDRSVEVLKVVGRARSRRRKGVVTASERT
jgi:hypothetical protein